MSSKPWNQTEPINLGLADRLRNDLTFRSKFIRRWAQNEIATQVRAMRQRRRMNQKQLASKSGTGQSAISRSEQADYDGWTFKTLVRLAEALDARLRISFEPIEDVIGLYEATDGQTNAIVGSASTFVSAPFSARVGLAPSQDSEVAGSFEFENRTWTDRPVETAGASGGYANNV